MTNQYQPPTQTRPAVFGQAADDHPGALDLAAHLCPNPANAIIGTMRGEAMTDFGIPDGALLICERQTAIGVGQFVLVEVSGSLYLRQARTVDGAPVLGNAHGGLFLVDEQVRCVGVLRWVCCSWGGAARIGVEVE